MGYKDSKFHPDCKPSKDHPERKPLKKTLLELLGVSTNDSTWREASLVDKTEIGRLWIPGLTKNQVEDLFQNVTQLQEIRDSIFGKVTYWNDVQLLTEEAEIDQEGEVFFETFTGYKLHSL